LHTPVSATAKVASADATQGQQRERETTMTTIDKTKTIQKLNDAFRRTGEGGRILFTQGVSSLGVAFSHQALALVQRFEDFTPDNDPHREHDFGSFTLHGHKLFWKIDYYDQACEFGSEDPADPVRTTRVLTIMLASEY